MRKKTTQNRNVATCSGQLIPDSKLSFFRLVKGRIHSCTDEAADYCCSPSGIR